jgi:predicted metal-dependent hydrolase
MLFDSLKRAPKLAPGDLIEVAGRPVRLAVHAKARRVSLRLDTARREVVATAPNARRLAEAAAFAQSRREWIAARLDGLPQPLGFVPGATVPLLGEDCRLERAAMRIRPRIIPARDGEGPRLLAHGEGEAYGRAVERALRAHALEHLTERTAAHAAALGQPMPSIAVMDARARWGSCRAGPKGAAGQIRYNWRLVLCPPEVADYVAAHECGHLLEANHGPRFWAVVRGLYGETGPAQAWLKANGARLHAVGRA